MGFRAYDGFFKCNTGLGLGLGFHMEKQENCPQSHRRHHQYPQNNKKLSLKYDHVFPSLTLGLPQAQSSQPQASNSISCVSSFSNPVGVKKEGDDQLGGCGDQEVEVERVSSSRASDCEDEEGSPRKKLRLTKEQSSVLEDNFKEHTTLNPKQKQALAEQLNLRPRQVEVWFQNRRARTKVKQTEVDCELLKKCCETLTEENKRLQKELQDLKSMKMAAPLCMQLPAATRTMCPSCEGIARGVSDRPPTSTLTFGTKPHF